MQKSVDTLWERTLPLSRTFRDSIRALTCRLVNSQVVVMRLVSEIVKHCQARPMSLLGRYASSWRDRTRYDSIVYAS